MIFFNPVFIYLTANIVWGLEYDSKTNDLNSYIIALIKDWNHKDVGVHDVVILRFESEKYRKNSTEIVGGLFNKMPIENPIMSPPIFGRTTRSDVRVGSFIIVLFDGGSIVSIAYFELCI